MRPVLERPRPRSAHSSVDWSLAAFAACAVAVVTMFVTFVGPALSGPSFIDAVIIENPHPWHAVVEVTGGDGDGWLALASPESSTSMRVDGVVDQGDTWVFRFRYAGVDGGELTVDRADLEAAGWRVAVPESFAGAMRAAGLAPSAR